MMYPRAADETLPYWVSRVNRDGYGFVEDLIIDKSFANNFYLKPVCNWLKKFKADLDNLPAEQKKELEESIEADKIEDTENILNALECDEVLASVST